MTEQFSPAQFTALIDSIQQGFTKVASLIDEITYWAGRAVEILPDMLARLVCEALERLGALGRQVAEKSVEILRGYAAPLVMYQTASAWQSVRGRATLVQGTVRPEVLQVDGHWKGVAADAYVRAVRLQGDAAGRVGAAATATADALTAAAHAGVVYYVAIAVAVTTLVTGLTGAAAATATGWGAPAGVALAGLSTAETIAIVAGAGGGLAALLGFQANSLVKIRGEQLDVSTFPNGKWPLARTESYSDATVTDGDAEWSFER